MPIELLQVKFLLVAVVEGEVQDVVIGVVVVVVVVVVEVVLVVVLVLETGVGAVTSTVNI